MSAIPNNPAGWWMSEKLDGVFCRFTGTVYLSRNGHRFTPPAWWLASLPSGVRLDGELWMGRGTFNRLVGEIQRKQSNWSGIRFMIFDLAVLRVPIEDRLAALGRLPLPPHCQLVQHRRCGGAGDLDQAEREVVDGGGEGLCLRAPGSSYAPCGFVKVKRIHADLDRSILD